jgi:hypothetical protein
MITGDYPGTALEIAREIGLDHRAGCITGQELGAMTDYELARRVRSVSVFARMIPEQKLQLARGMASSKHGTLTRCRRRDVSRGTGLRCILLADSAQGTTSPARPR